MALSPIFYARGDSNSANNAALNVQSLSVTPVTSIQFTSGTSGDLVLDFVADDADADTIPEFDPDTQVIINGITYNFVFLKSGTLDPARTNPPLENAMAYVIKVDFNGDGDVLDKDDKQYFFTTIPTVTAANMANDIQNGALALGGLDLDPPPTPVCFCAGTDIATPSGPRKVERLVAGDMVLNSAGDAVQVVWAGSTRVSRRDLRATPDLRPIRIPAGAFGPSLPDADLLVSPQHRIVLEGPAAEMLFGEAQVLAAAKHLVGTFAEIEVPEADVDYFHILTEAHEILVANGLPSESFQPARRTVDVMSADARALLEQTLATLGRADMLSRKDALLSLKGHEAQTLAAMMQQPGGAKAAFAPVTLAQAAL